MENRIFNIEILKYLIYYISYMEEENKPMEEEINKIVVDFGLGTNISETPKEEQPPPPPQETQHKHK